VKDVVNMKNITHVLRVINTYVLSALIRFVLVLTRQGPVSQWYIASVFFVGKYTEVMLRFMFVIGVLSY